MRTRALLIEAKEALIEAQAQAIAAIGLRGEEAKSAMHDARERERANRWRKIVWLARKGPGAVTRLREDDIDQAQTGNS